MMTTHNEPHANEEQDHYNAGLIGLSTTIAIVVGTVKLVSLCLNKHTHDIVNDPYDV